MRALPLLLLALAAPAVGQRRGDQDQALRGRQMGELLPLRQIEGGIVPAMSRRGAVYIGPELQGTTQRYRLKFVRNGQVIWIDVDGRTGEVVGRAGE